jgi:hypothetical protein
MVARRLNMEPWMVCRPVVADLHHFDEEPHKSEKSEPDPNQRKKKDPNSH